MLVVSGSKHGNAVVFCSIFCFLFCLFFFFHLELILVEFGSRCKIYSSLW